MYKKDIIKELSFKAVRSSGAGGQHVNKVSTKIELSFRLADSLALSEHQKIRIQNKLAYRLTKDHVLILHCDETRSQHKNKDLVIKRFLNMMEEALKVPKTRRATKPTRSSVEKRLKGKQSHSLKKAHRRKPSWED